MNRNDILKAINYNGEYTKEVKKKLRELLKKYHPDHYKKESDTFKLISDIKKDLDNNKKINVVKKKEVKKSNISDDYKITNEISELYKKLDDVLAKKKKCEEEFSILHKEYQKEYDNYVNHRNDEVDHSNEVIVMQSKKQKYNIILIATFFISTIFIFTKWYYPLIITLILFVYMTYLLVKTDTILTDYLNKNNENAINSSKSINKISSINKEINKLYKKIWELDCEKNRLNTRINLLKAKIR